MSFISFENVTFNYDPEEADSKNVLENFNLSIEEGSFVAILGHNGCGKSTVAKLCNGIEIPVIGRVTVDGIDTSVEETINDVRKKVGMVFQNPDNQIVATIVEDDVAFGPENLGIEPKEIRRRVDEALKSVGLYDLRFYEPHRLSGGQRQRVAIAGILAMQPKCIVFDESTAMLDPSGRREVLETAKKFNAEGITIVLITHYMDEAAKADRVIVMNEGVIELDGTPEEVFSNDEKLLSIGLEVPEATNIAKQLGFEKTVLDMDCLSEEILKKYGK